MIRPGLDEYYLRMAELVATRGTCPRRQVGAVIIDAGGKLVSIGYNGPPKGMPHCYDTPCPGAGDPSGNNDRCEAIHAETNAIMQASSSRREPWMIYCTTTPCFNCAKLIISAGIKMVVAKTAYTDRSGIELLEKAGVRVVVSENPKIW